MTIGSAMAVTVPNANSRITIAAAMPIALAVALVGLRHRVAHVSARGHVEAGVLGRVGRVDDGLGASSFVRSLGPSSSVTDR